MADDASTLARPYAKAIFEFARDQDQLESMAGRLAFWAAVATDDGMKERLADPSATHERRAELFIKVTGDELDDTGRNIIRLLAENDRLGVLPQIFLQYEEMRGEAEGEIEARVTSAFPLNEAQEASLVEALSRRLDRRVRIVTEIDESLIGGAIIKAGDLVIDGSLRGRVDKLQHAVAS